MQYIKVSLKVEGEVKLFNIPVMDTNNSLNIQFKDICSNVADYKDIVALPFKKAEIIIDGFSDYIEPIKVKDFILPALLNTEGHTDMTSLAKNYFKILKMFKLPCVINNEIAFDSINNKYTKNSKVNKPYINNYLTKEAYQSDLDYYDNTEDEDSDEDLDEYSAEGLCERMVFSRYLELTETLDLYNFIGYDILNRAKDEPFKDVKTEQNLLREKYPWLFSIVTLCHNIKKFPLSNICENGKFWYKGQRELKAINQLDYKSYRKDMNIIAFLNSVFQLYTSLSNHLCFKSVRVAKLDLYKDVYKKVNGDDELQDISPMFECDDTLKLPIPSLYQLAELGEVLKRNLDVKDNLEYNTNTVKNNILYLIDCELEFKQRDFAFPYSNANMYSENYISLYQNGQISKEEYMSLLGDDKLVEDGNKVYDSEKLAYNDLVNLHKDLLLYEYGDQYNLTNSNVMEFCKKNNLRSNLYLYYITVLSCNIASITYAHAGTFSNIPSFEWLTKRGYQESLQGKVSASERYKDKSKLISEESMYRKFSEIYNYRINNVKEDSLILGDFFLSEILSNCYKEDLNCLENIVLRLARFGKRRPSCIKIQENRYFYPLTCDVKNYYGSLEELNNIKIDGYDGKAILVAFINVNDNFVEAKLGTDSEINSIPLFVTFERFKEGGNTVKETVDIITACKDLNLKGLDSSFLDFIELKVDEIKEISTLTGNTFTDSLEKATNRDNCKPFYYFSLMKGLEGEYIDNPLVDSVNDWTISKFIEEIKKGNNKESLAYSYKIIFGALKKLLVITNKSEYIMGDMSVKLQLITSFIKSSRLNYDINYETLSKANMQEDIINQAVKGAFGNSERRLDISKPVEEIKTQVEEIKEKLEDTVGDVSNSINKIENVIEEHIPSEFDNFEVSEEENNVLVNDNLKFGRDRDLTKVLQMKLIKTTGVIYLVVDYDTGDVEITSINQQEFEYLEKRVSELISERPELSYIKPSKLAKGGISFISLKVIEAYSRNKRILTENQESVDELLVSVKMKLEDSIKKVGGKI